MTLEVVGMDFSVHFSHFALDFIHVTAPMYRNVLPSPASTNCVRISSRKPKNHSLPACSANDSGQESCGAILR